MLILSWASCGPWPGLHAALDASKGGQEIRAESNRATAAAAGLCLGLALTIGCGPAFVTKQDFNRNPLEIIEESPRIYHIMFEPFADSLETVRVMNYMSGMVPYGFYLPEDTSEMELTRRDSSLLEYRKAVKRLDAGAGQAGLLHVRRAIEKDPAFLPSYVLLARILIEDGQIIRAKDILEQVLSRNPTYSGAFVELARCYMYMGQFDLAKRALIDAVIFERTNLNAWSELQRLGMVERFEVAARDAPELAFVEKASGRNLDMIVDSSLVDCPMEASAWIVFASQRAVWKYEGKYQQRYGGSTYRKTYDEDVDCYMSLAVAWKVLSGQQDSTFLTDQAACESEYLDFLAEVSDGGHLISHVLMDYVCLQSPGAARHFPPDVIERMRDYVDKFVIVRESST